jgi:hypothetical protein
MVNAHSTTTHSKKTDDDDKATSKEIKEEIVTTPEHSFKEIKRMLNNPEVKANLLDNIANTLIGPTGNSPSEQQYKALKDKINKELLNKLD